MTRAVDVASDTTRLTLDTIGLCGFDNRSNSFYRSDQHPFVAAMVDALERANEKSSARFGASKHPLAGIFMEELTRWLRPSAVEEDAFAGDEQMQHDREVMCSLVDELIRARKALGPDGIAAHHDLLSAMLTGIDKQSGERLDDITIRYEILTFLVAGHETTSGLLTFTLYFLSKHPEVYQRVCAEADHVLGTELSVAPTYEQAHHLTYVQQVLKESLRRWPTAPAFTRHPYEPTTLAGTYDITPDDVIMVLTPMLHRDTSVWGTDAEDFTATIASLDEYTYRLPTDGPVVIVTSSYNGTPPDNTGKFCAWLRDATLASDALRGVRYAVFGCGNHEWTATFQAIPRLVDGKLHEHGGERIFPLSEGDTAGDFDDTFQAWSTPLWPALAQAFALQPAASEAAVPATVAAPVAGTPYQVERDTAPVNPLIAANGVKPLMIRTNRELVHGNGQQSHRSTRHIEVLLPVGETYQTGDHLGVLPRNRPAMLQRVLQRFGLAGDAYLRIHRNGTSTPALPIDQPVNVIDLLSHYAELQEIIARAQIATLAEYTSSPAEKEQLLSLADGTRYQEEILAKRITIRDLLERFPSCTLPFKVYLELLHPLRVRYCSISSSPLADGHACSITVSVVEAPARSGQGTYEGVCSTYLAQHPAESMIDGFIRSPHMAFHPPEDMTIPLIMVGPGAGLAPFRGFLQERAARTAQGAQLGPALLFYGCRHPDQDFLYKEELEGFATDGVVTLYPAFSRADGQAKSYVQDKIREHANEVWNLMQAGAIIYICGDGGHMEPAVRQTLTELYQQRASVSPSEAEAWQVGLRESDRYLADVWANG
jgi:sulfite reductase alpha subunit-like flavoprotein